METDAQMFVHRFTFIYLFMQCENNENIPIKSVKSIESTCTWQCTGFRIHIVTRISFSTKRVDHSNTRLSSQLERNPGEFNLAIDIG